MEILSISVLFSVRFRLHFIMERGSTVYFQIYCSITFFVIVSNAIILLLLIKKHRKQRRSHKFITSMIISDLCSGIVCFSYGFVLYYPKFQIDYVGCCFANLIFIVTFRFNSLLIKLTTAIDRYWAIVHPISYHMKATDNKIKGKKKK